jgi:ATP-dependent Clp protease ATP-binding subunit ClpX
MKEIMFDIPSNEEVAKVIINADTIKTRNPQLVLAENGKREKLKVTKKN